MDTEYLSGDYKGYYAYNHDSSHYEMKVSLVFDDNGIITGHGQDSVNAFTFNGKMNLDTNAIKLTKSYPSHNVEYSGHLSLDYNMVTMSGDWNINSKFPSSGVFTLRKGEANQEEVMADIDKIEAILQKEMAAIEEVEIQLF